MHNVGTAQTLADELLAMDKEAREAEVRQWLLARLRDAGLEPCVALGLGRLGFK